MTIKPANEITFLRQIKVSIKPIIISVGIKYSVRDLDVSNYV